MLDAIENAEVIEAGMKAWNQLTVLMDDSPETFDHPEDFREFYKLVMERLLEEEVSD